MKSKLVWLAIGGMMLAGCGTVATTPAMTTAPQNNYQVMGGTPVTAPTTAPAPEVPKAPSIDCGSYAPWAAVERDYGFNVGNGVPFGYRDVIYDASPWARGFGHDYLPFSPCAACDLPVSHPVPKKPGKGNGNGNGNGGNGTDTGETTTNY